MIALFHLMWDMYQFPHLVEGTLDKIGKLKYTPRCDFPFPIVQNKYTPNKSYLISVSGLYLFASCMRQFDFNTEEKPHTEQTTVQVRDLSTKVVPIHSALVNELLLITDLSKPALD